jgi:lipase chaperone LimK
MTQASRRRGESKPRVRRTAEEMEWVRAFYIEKNQERRLAREAEALTQALNKQAQEEKAARLSRLLAGIPEYDRWS